MLYGDINCEVSKGRLVSLGSVLQLLHAFTARDAEEWFSVQVISPFVFKWSLVPTE